MNKQLWKVHKMVKSLEILVKIAKWALCFSDELRDSIHWGDYFSTVQRTEAKETKMDSVILTRCLYGYTHKSMGDINKIH